MADAIAKLPDLCRAGLADLYRRQEGARYEAKHAEEKYNAALHSAVAALGLDPQSKLNINLDTGAITLPDPPE